MKIARSNLLLAPLAAAVLALGFLASSPLSVARAFDGQVPMPPASGWPSYPRPVTRVEIPAACGTAFHNLWCAQNSKLERALEQELWLLLGNLGTPTDPAVSGLQDWIGRVASYVGYTSRITGLPTPQYLYGGYAGGPEKNRARLTMLLGAANMALFRVYDVEAIADAVQTLDLVKLIASAPQIPALFHVIEALKYADEAAYLMPWHQNALAFGDSIGAFLQWALPIDGVDIGKLLPNVRGTVGLRRAYPLGFQGGKASLGLLMDPAAPCSDETSCRALAGTEGVVAAALSLQLMGLDAVPPSAWPGLDHEPSLVAAGVDVMHDPLLGDCGTYACSHTTSIAPFKKLGVLLLTATAYGRLGDLDRMRDVLTQVHDLAAQQQWPFMTRLLDMQAHLEGTGAYAGQGLLAQWKAQPNKRLGLVQLPLAPATGVSSCSSCHYAAQMPDPNVYER